MKGLGKRKFHSPPKWSARFCVPLVACLGLAALARYQLVHVKVPSTENGLISGIPAVGAPTQQAYLKGWNTAAGAMFGFAVAVSDDTAVAGAPCEAGNSIGANGRQGVWGLTNSGAAYIYSRGGTNWTLQTRLTPSNDAPGDSFGYSVAIAGTTVVVGAPWDGSSGFHPARSDTAAREAGSAFVFVRNGSNWIQEACLKASNAKPGQDFGGSIAVSGSTVLVGARTESSKSAGVNGDQTDTSAQSAGAAYVFVRIGTNWMQQAYLKASNPDKEDGFGTSVSVSGDTAVVGAWWEDSASTGIDGDQNNNGAKHSGAAYVFVRNGTNWMQQAYLKASNTGQGNLFGKSVAVSGDTVVVGAEGEGSDAVGVNGTQSAKTVGYSGAAYIFVRNGNAWSQEAFLKPRRTRVNMAFGTSVAISGDSVVVGAPGEASGSGGINGDQSNTKAPNSGAAYVFMRNGTNWIQKYYLKASNPDGCTGRVYFDILGRLKTSSRGTCDQFGWSVGVSEDTAIVGAMGEASKATGVNGDQKDNSAKDAGAAYVFGGLASERSPPHSTVR